MVMTTTMTTIVFIITTVMMLGNNKVVKKWSENNRISEMSVKKRLSLDRMSSTRENS